METEVRKLPLNEVRGHLTLSEVEAFCTNIRAVVPLSELPSVVIYGILNEVTYVHQLSAHEMVAVLQTRLAEANKALAELRAERQQEDSRKLQFVDEVRKQNLKLPGNEKEVLKIMRTLHVGVQEGLVWLGQAPSERQAFRVKLGLDLED